MLSRNKAENLGKIVEDEKGERYTQEISNREEDASTQPQSGEQNYVPRCVYKAPLKKYANPYDEYVKQQEKMLQQRKEANEKYSKISANLSQIQRSQPLKYIIREGNNHFIIERIIKNRLHKNEGSFENQPQQLFWEQTSNYDNLFNFKWQPVS
mmetsp:Transcript_14249/g.13817  ORF Transcript_14249/g.13817 Transcript_14249/m.13817 type:complete len:154 (-) Transcript_14249:1256-1717(-)